MTWNSENWATSIRFDRFYPLIAYETQHFPTGNTIRRVIRNPFIRRFSLDVLERLFARQVGKLLSRKMKPLMELPYAISGVFENVEAEAEYQRYSRAYFQSRLASRPRAKVDFDPFAVEMPEEEA